jgi:hypothetical protein
VRRELMRFFEQALLPMLSNVYTALGQVFESGGMFPSTAEIRESLARSAVRRSPSGVRIDPDAYRDMEPAVREAAMAAVFGKADGNPRRQKWCSSTSSATPNRDGIGTTPGPGRTFATCDQSC